MKINKVYVIWAYSLGFMHGILLPSHAAAQMLQKLATCSYCCNNPMSPFQAPGKPSVQEIEMTLLEIPPAQTETSSHKNELVTRVAQILQTRADYNRTIIMLPYFELWKQNTKERSTQRRKKQSTPPPQLTQIPGQKTREDDGFVVVSHDNLTTEEDDDNCVKISHTEE